MTLSDECKEWFYLTWKHIAVRKGWISDNNICRKWSMENLTWRLSFQVADVSSDEVPEDVVKWCVMGNYTSPLLFSVHLLSIRSSVFFFLSSSFHHVHEMQTCKLTSQSLISGSCDMKQVMTQVCRNTSPFPEMGCTFMYKGSLSENDS